jgi:hypothetical protein
MLTTNRQAAALENPVGNEYLNSTAFPILPPLSDIPRPLDIPDKRDSLLRGGRPESVIGSPVGKSPGVKRNPSSSSSVYRQAVGTSAQKKRLAGIGAASSHGRLFKVLADLFLLAGRIEDALVW